MTTSPAPQPPPPDHPTQHWDPAPDSAEIAAATARLLDAAHTLSDDDVRAPSLLPRWSRGHVLAHIAGNADSLVNLLTWAATGDEHPQYASQQARDAAIEAGAGDPIDAQIARLEASHERFVDAADRVPPENWHHLVRWMSGDPRPASKILDARLREVAIHHLDLDAGYSASDWPVDFALRILLSVLPAFESRGMEAVTLLPTDIDSRISVNGGSATKVSGPVGALATWLLGRDDGSELAVTGGELPKPPSWG